MSQPRHVFCSEIFPSADSFLNESGSSCFRGSDECSGWNSVFMTNRAVLFARSIQCLSSTVMVMVSLINSFIDNSVAVISTAKGSDVVIWLADCCCSSGGSMYRCGELISSVSQD